MAKKSEEVEERTPPVRTPAERPKSAFEQMRQFGYMTYTFAEKFEQRDLQSDPRPYPLAKRVNVLKIKEEDGSVPYVGLGFVGILDEPLFLIVMGKEEARDSLAGIQDPQDFVGFEFFGVTKRFGSVGLVSLSKDAYAKFAKTLKE
jgi:hypothetical protein